jgi:hypothetical protein
MERSKNYQGRQGLGCKTTLSSTSRTRTGANRGAAAALVAMGAGAPGIEGLSSGTKRIEEARANSMEGSPRAEDNGSGAESLVNGSGAIWSSGGAGSACGRRRMGGAQGDDLGQGCAAPGSASPFIGGSHAKAEA